VTEGPVVAGALAGDPRAGEFARIVESVHLRYAREVVLAYELCPFLHDPASAFGRFCVVLEREPDLATAVELVLAAPGVVHLVYPLVDGSCHAMERYGNVLHERIRREALARGDRDPPVHATFHPRMEGDANTPQRRIGLVRRAPDPFVQFVPQGLTGGGSKFLDPDTLDLAALLATPKKPPSRVGSLGPDELSALLATLVDIRRERDARYAGYFDAP